MSGEQVDGLIVQGGTAFGGALLGAGIAEMGVGAGGPAFGFGLFAIALALSYPPVKAWARPATGTTDPV